MNVVRHLIVDLGPVLAPAVLGGCWYAVALGLAWTETDPGTAAD